MNGLDFLKGFAGLLDWDVKYRMKESLEYVVLVLGLLEGSVAYLNLSYEN